MLASAVTFGLLALRYAGGSSPRWLDDRAESLVDGLTPREAGGLIVLGSPPVVIAFAVLAAGICLWLGHRKLAVLAVLGPGLTGLITTVTKPLVARVIDDAYVYPSGHTGGATAVGLVMALLLVRLLRPSPARAGLLLTGCALLIGGTVGVLVVAEDWHYATDAVGGFLVAVAAVLGCALLLDVLPRRVDEPTPHPRRW